MKQLEFLKWSQVFKMVSYRDPDTSRQELNILINSPRSYSAQSLSFSTPRTPSTTNDTFVIISIEIDAQQGETGEVLLQVDDGGGFDTIATVKNDNNTLLTLRSIQTYTFSSVIAKNSAYQLVSTGDADNTIVSANELTF